MKKQRGIKGFTLVELLIYTAIFTMTAGLLTSILIMISNIQTKENASFEVTRQLQFITQTVQYAIRDSAVVEAVYEGNDPAIVCTQFCSIRLRESDPALDPTIITSDAGGVYIQEGANPKVPLTSTKVRVSSLTFSKTNNPGGMSTTAVGLSIIYDGGTPELTFTKSLTSAIAHVQAATFDSELLPDTDAARGVGSSTLRWRDATLSNGITIAGPETVGDTTNLTLRRGTAHGSTTLGQYYTSGTPDKYGTHMDVGGTPLLYLEADSGTAARRAYILNGNLGIGTTAPSSPLYVYNNTAWTSYTDDEYPAIFRTNSYVGIKVKADGNGYAPASVVLESTQGISRGQGIYYSNPTTSNLWFSGTPYTSSNDRYIIAYKSSATFTGDVAQTASALMTVLTNGNVGIGMAPTYKLDVAGDLRITGTPYRAGGDIAWTVPSDLRLKNIKSEYTSGLKEILSLNPVRYTYKENKAMELHSDKEYVGIIAQEAQKIIPESVSADSRTGYLTLNTTPIFWSIINAIKDLNKSDDDLRAQIRSQQEQINSLESRLKAIETR